MDDIQRRSAAVRGWAPFPLDGLHWFLSRDVILVFIVCNPGSSRPHNVELAAQSLFSEKDIVALILLLQLVVDPLEVVELGLKEMKGALEGGMGR